MISTVINIIMFISIIVLMREFRRIRKEWKAFKEKPITSPTISVASGGPYRSATAPGDKSKDEPNFRAGDICAACNNDMRDVKPITRFCTKCKLTSEPHLHKSCYDCDYSWLAQCHDAKV